MRCKARRGTPRYIGRDEGVMEGPRRGRMNECSFLGLHGGIGLGELMDKVTYVGWWVDGWRRDRIG